MQIDRIRILNDKISIWLVYAGKNRSLLDEFIQHSSVFLSLPGFDANGLVFDDDVLIGKHLAMSEQVALWNFGHLASPPSRKSSLYLSSPHASGSPEAKAFSAELGNIRRLYREAKAGDIVLSPRKGQLEPFLIGEIRENWSPGEEASIAALANEIVPIRRVRWLDTALARRDFAPIIARRLRNQKAVTRLDDRFYKEIIDLVYPSYIWNGLSKLDVFGEDYRGDDPTQITPTAYLIKYIIASVLAFERGEINKFLSMSSALAIKAYYDHNLIEHFGQNFNSPGSFSVISRRNTMAALTAVGIIIAAAGATGHVPSQVHDAVHSVSMALQGTGKQVHVHHVDNYAHSMTSVDWKKVQMEQGEPAREAMSISLSASSKVARHRDRLNAR